MPEDGEPKNVDERASALDVPVQAGRQGAPPAGGTDERFDGLSVTASDDGALTFDEGLARSDCTVCRDVEAATT